MEQNRSRSIRELMWEDQNQHIQESLRPTDVYPYQHTIDSQGRMIDDSYEEHASTSISAQLAEITNLIASLQPPRAAQQVHPMAISCDYCGEYHTFRNCPYNAVAYGHTEDYNSRLDVLLREATYDINNMLQQSTHWDTEILMQESNTTTTLSEAEKSNASANSEESDAKNDITTLLLKQESVNYSYQHLPQQSHDDMLGQQDGGAMLMEYEEPSKVGYDCLGDDTSSMVIPSNSNVGAVPKSLLMEMIKKSEENDGCMLEYFKRDGPSLGLHRILVEDCYSNWREQQLPQQRRLHPTKMEDDENEVIKWLGVDITFPLNIFMPSRILARWRVFMDYKGTRKKYTSMVAQKGAIVSILTRFFFRNIVT
ncbi:hypothetical protein V6N13_116038 [Hibiscus sabdariffa]|uniref:Uncharacterized protein n=1 Tax=Hibiscus sabdariffa TaxID=183260 RepID=A0ABR2QT07_9ROSI